MFEFFDEEPYFQVKDLVKPIKDFPETVICTWQNKLVNVAMKKYGGQTIGTFHTGVVCPIYKLDCNGFETGLILLPVGGPCVSGFIEEAAFWGAKHIVFAGYCGVLGDSVGESLIVPTKAFRDEGTSYHYIFTKEDFIHVKTFERTAEVLSSLGVPFVKGPVWTTDSLYRETPSAIKSAKKMGCIGVDMECACIHSVAQAKKIDCFQFFFTADRLTGDSWEEGKLHSDNRDAYLNYFEIALALAKSATVCKEQI